MISSPLLGQIAPYWAGGFQAAAGAAAIDVFNPADGELLARVPDCGRQETTQAINAAAAAQGELPSTATRRGWLEKIAGQLGEHRAELGRIITLENGKPLKEAMGEVDYAAGFFAFYAGHLEILEPRMVGEAVRGCQWRVIPRPAGVVGLITPWNFPIAMLAKKFAAGLAAGCAIVARPAEITPLTSIAFFHLLHDLDLPRGRVNLVLGRPEPIAAALFEHPAVRLISFTGSTRVGQKLIEQSARGIKRVALELGGNAPFIVFEDADLSTAADELIANKFRAAGQTCVCANRILVQRGIVEEFSKLVVERVGRLKMGNGLDPDVNIGPLINRAGYEKVAAHFRDALDRGACCLIGGLQNASPSQRPYPNLFPPAVLTAITPQMRCFTEETFGPLIPILEFTSEQQALNLANSTPFGLASYIFTRDTMRAERMIPQLLFGHVGLNTGTGPAPHAPFGGIKFSGFGREGGIEGMLEFTETQTIAAKNNPTYPAP